MKRSVIAFSAMALLVCSQTLLAKDTGRSVVKTGDIAEDLYLAGAEVRVMANVEGDVVVSGGEIIVERRVANDVIAAGGRVLLRAEVGDDVRLVGGEVLISGDIGDDAIAAGGSVHIDREAQVRGRAWLAGGNIEVAGRIDDKLDAHGGRVVISGHIGGDVELVADDIQILPEAVIEGDFVYRSPHPAEIDDGATISGGIKHTSAKVWPKIEIGKIIVVGLMVMFAALVGAIAAGIVLYLLFPVMFDATAKLIRADMLSCLGLGFVLFIGLPLLAIMLMISVLGIPLSVIIIIGYILGLIVAVFIGAYYIGDLGVQRFHKEPQAASKFLRVVSIVAALVLIAIVKMIPFFGALVVFLLLLMGFGALTKFFFHRLWK